MKVTFFSNFLNHHQTPFCDEMYKHLEGNFTFVSTEKIPEYFLKNGYPDCTNYPYNLNSYQDETNFKKALQLGFESDIVIKGASPEIFIKERLLHNKYVFRISERVLKKGWWQIIDPRVLYSLLKVHTQYRNKNQYVLCASAYLAKELNLIFAYQKKKYKWGYFTKVEKLNIEQVIAQKSTDRIELLWTARLIDWKHPELAVKLAYELKKRDYNFHMNIIGEGIFFESIQKLIDKLHLCKQVTLLKSMPNPEVRYYMQKSNVFLFTSDRNEGWGAVLNEAMSCGCAVVSSNMIGATPYLINDGENGLIFKSGSLSKLVQQTERLINDQSLRNKLSLNAYHTMQKTWNPEKAAANFMLLAKSIMEGKEIIFEDGPCSKEF